MKIINRNNINISKYEQALKENNCFEAAMQPWVLDIVNPNWKMLCHDNGNYITPLPVRQKYGIQYITMPIFGQKLSILNNKVNPVSIVDIAKYLKRKFLRININFDCKPPKAKGFTDKSTYILPLNKPYEEIWEDMDKGHRKNIRIAMRNNTIVKSPIDTSFLFRMKEELYGQRDLKFSDYDKSALSNLFDTALNQHKSPYYIVFHDKIAVASAIYVKIGNRFVIESAVTSFGRKTNSGYLLINQFIRDNANTQATLDFAGSNIPSIAKFKKGFGAIHQEYTNFMWKWL